MSLPHLYLLEKTFLYHLGGELPVQFELFKFLLFGLVASLVHLVEVDFEHALRGSLLFGRDDRFQVKCFDDHAQILDLNFSDVVAKEQPEIACLGVVMGVYCGNLGSGQCSKSVAPSGNQPISIDVGFSDPDVRVALLVSGEKQGERLDKFNDGDFRLEAAQLLAHKHSFVFPKPHDLVTAATRNNV